jgi:DNA polymerase II small subunit/DNA polymerase delta subunit B
MDPEKEKKTELEYTEVEPEKKEDGTPVDTPDEKSEIQIEVEKLRVDNQGLRAEMGRVPELNSRIDKMTNQINELLESRQTPAETDEEEYVTVRKLKEFQGDSDAAAERALTAREQKKANWDKEYLQEVAKLSTDVTDDETLTGILSELDTNFRDDSNREIDPKIQAKINYPNAKASYVTKAMSAGKQVKFASNTPAKVSLSVGSPTGDKPIQREEKEIVLPSDAKALLDDPWLSNTSSEDKKTLVKGIAG